MNVFSILLAALAPGISLLLFFYLRDRYEPEPIQFVGKLFGFGILLVFPVVWLQQFLMEYFSDRDLFFSFVLAGGIEEFAKWLILLLSIYRHPEFDEPYDAIVYAVAISLGFASLENILYAFLFNLSFSELLLRALLPVSGHALFGVVMGYYLGKAKFKSSFAKLYLSLSLVIPVFWHGLFDWMILTTKSYFIWFILPFMMYLWMRSLQKIKLSQAHSIWKTSAHQHELDE